MSEKLRELLADVELVCTDAAAAVVEEGTGFSQDLSDELDTASSAPLQKQLRGLAERARDARLELDYRQLWPRPPA